MTGLLGESLTYSMKMAECRRCCLPVVQSPYPGEHVPSSAGDSHSEPVLLALPGGHMSNVVLFRTEWQGPFREDASFP